MTSYACCDDRRRGAIAGRAGLNGIDSLEVVDLPGSPLGPPLTTLVVHFINPPTGLTLTTANVSITGGERFKAIKVLGAGFRDPVAGVLDDRALVVTVDRAGDFSVYQLTLTDGTAAAGAPAGVDPVLRTVDFLFRPGCDAGFDVVQPAACPPPVHPVPPIDYLARDWTSLRQVLLDRLAVLSPGSVADDPVDLAVTLVELLAYVGDSLSYRQDAVATEATLDTCRQRISARRHARLVDYSMHDGCNARVWVLAQVGAPLLVPAGTKLFTTTPGIASVASETELEQAVAGGAQVFETMQALRLDPALNSLRLHAWGGQRCCLPAGAISATLRGDVAALLPPGTVLMLMEVKGPDTGDAADADPGRRWPVRLTAAKAAVDPVGAVFDDGPVPADPSLPVTEIAWGVDDALPFPLCISSELAGSGATLVRDVSVARGNVVLADHGSTEDLPGSIGVVPFPTLFALAAPRPAETVTADPADAPCSAPAAITIPARFQPGLAPGALTHAAALDTSSAAAALRTLPGQAQAVVRDVVSIGEDGTRIGWTQRFPDLLGAGLEPVFVVEVDNGFTGSLRFGDGVHGMRPPAGAAFVARARLGNGVAGNVGAGTLTHMVLAAAEAAAPVLSNPLPAVGGVEPQSIESVRREAPFAFRVQRRAVTPGDYADQAGGFAGVQRASANLRWTGSWHTHFVAADRLGGAAPDAAFDAGLAAFLDPLRLAGHDVQIEPPLMAPIDVTLRIRLDAGQSRAAMRQALLLALGSAGAGLFAPDRFTFGQAVYLSPVIAAAQAVAGVAWVQVVQFERRDAPGSAGIALGRLEMARNEIARLDNDPDFPDRGVLTLLLEGGR